jgi:2-oxoglutarate ferredoxin oxidoreductase subunit alpha
MIKIRAEKINKIANHIPLQTIDNGTEEGDILVLSWGGTYGIIKSAVADLINEGIQVSHVHLRYIHPFPKNLGAILKRFKTIIVPELNHGQLVKIIRDRFLAPAQGFNKIQGQPFSTTEIKDRLREEWRVIQENHEKALS